MELTDLQKRILQTAQEAQDQRLSPNQLADKAGCSLNQLFKELEDTGFRNIFNDSLRTAVTAEVPAILQAFVERAKAGSYQHGKMILEIAGTYTEKQQIDLNAEVKSDLIFDSKEEADEFIKATMSDYLENKEKLSDGEE